MRKAIKDEFSDLPVSRQRKYQLRMGRDGRCVICGESAGGKVLLSESHGQGAGEGEEKNWSKTAFEGSA